MKGISSGYYAERNWNSALHFILYFFFFHKFQRTVHSFVGFFEFISAEKIDGIPWKNTQRHQNTMPAVLLKAHQTLDKAVDLCYRSKPFINEAKRVEFLFELYDKYTAGLFVKEKKKKVK